jgi:hypothetical protein
VSDTEKLQRIRELHSPVPIPEGMQHMVFGPGEAPCSGCSTGDPYLDEPWPCETRKICDEQEEQP